MTYKDAFNKAFPGFNIIMEADIGHIKPVMTIINGIENSWNIFIPHMKFLL